MTAPPKALIVVNTDGFFVSHRLAVGRALLEAGFHVTVAAGESDARATIEGCGMAFRPLPFEPGGRAVAHESRTVAALFSLYRSERPDVVHHVTIKPVLYGSIVARLLRVPAIVNAVSGLGYVFIEQPHESRAKFALRAGVQRAYRLALSGPNTRTIFQNPDDQALFEERGLVRPGRSVLIAGSGVDTERFVPAPLPPGPPLVVLPARLLWDKGVGEFVEAARALGGELPGVRFALVGGADSQNPATVPTATLEKWRREGVVEWWGHRRDMPAVFAGCHLVVLPSYREGFPLALLEAAATARACVTTDVPGCRQAVRHGQTGWLVPARDSAALARTIREALSDRAELARRGELARAYALERFGLRAVVGETLAVYRALLGPRFPRALPASVAPIPQEDDIGSMSVL